MSVNNIEINSNNFCYDASKSDVENVDLNFEKLNKILIRSCREAEKKQLKKNSDVKRKKVKIRSDPEVYAIINQVENIKQLEQTCNVRNEYLKAKLKNLNTDLRRIQRKKLFEKERKDSLKLENHLNKNKNEFWQTIKNHRNKSNQANTMSNDLNINNFADYYSNVFSHHDRPSNENQKK